MKYAHVAVPVPARVGRLFSYAIPAGMAAQPGCIAIVPFGSRVLPGIVARVDSLPPDVPTRDLLGLVEGAPTLGAERVQVALWIASYYRCSPFGALTLFLPPGWQRCIQQRGGSNAASGQWEFEWPRPPLSEETVIDLAEGALVEVALTGVRVRVVEVLRHRGPSSAREVMDETGVALVTLRRMVREGTLVRMGNDLTPPAPLPDTGRGSDQSPLPKGEGQGEGNCLVVSQVGLCPENDPSPRSSPTAAGEGVLASPSPRGGGGRGVGSVPPPPIVLSDAQQGAFKAIADALKRREHQVTLLHGVTGSGKTHIYLKLIETLVALGRQTIVLVSEIAQTPEALRRYSERFPGRVALMHSALPDHERVRLWRGVYEGQYDVVVGPRSALFAPVPQLGLVVLDEEHEPAYKQEGLDPQYHARDVAIELGRRTGAAVLLGSATPDVASYYLAERGVYQLLSIPSRYEGPSARGWSAGALPRVEIVDLREELKARNRSLFSRSLQVALERTLSAGEQAILFLNRRGSSTSVVCRDCGHVLKCRRCDLPMVFHREQGGLVCHSCNRRTAIPDRCPQCKGSRISYFGAGTERVEEEARRLFPSARVLRWDHDVAGKPSAHDHLHRQFRDREADILVGTQMVAKALDFPMVTLVGVVLADVTLHLPDFRAAERTFQLLAQVAGRAGRGAREGRVIFQTYTPQHYSLVAASRHDYGSFYQQEMAFRRFHSYPPFRRMARLLFSGGGEARAGFEALRMRETLHAKVEELGIADVDVLGPAPAFHHRIRARYRWQIVLVGEGLGRLLEEIHLPLGWSLDVDPVSLL